VQAGAPELAVVHVESQRAHQVQAGAGVGAQPDHVAGVGRDLGLVEDEVEHRAGRRAGGGQHIRSPRYQAMVFPSVPMKRPLSLSPSASIPRSTPSTASSGEVSASLPPMSVRTQPGLKAATTMPRSASAWASCTVAMFSAALLSA